MRANMDSFQPATDEDVGLSEQLELIPQVDPQAKDLIGEVYRGKRTDESP
jgi:hypothetical protein